MKHVVTKICLMLLVAIFASSTVFAQKSMKIESLSKAELSMMHKVTQVSPHPNYQVADNITAVPISAFPYSQDDPIMIGQIQILEVPDMDKAIKTLEENKESLLAAANELDPVLVKFGGGAKDMELRPIDTEIGPMLIVHLLVDCRDAMGANAVNTMAEALAPTMAELTGGRSLLHK